jgi:leucyl/phenylalanyl-tRNA--protein transferase
VGLVTDYAAMRSSPDHITADIVLQAYAMGLFPMSESADDPSLFWVEPRTRGLIPLDGFRLSKSLRQTIRSGTFTISIDRDFDAVIGACASTRKDTWINPRIRGLFGELFDRGMVHTVECRQNGQLVGGLYGLSIGAVFFGESMFHTVTDASKTALAFLVARLIYGGYRLLDTQFVTPHLTSLGAIEMDRLSYRGILRDALEQNGDFHALGREQADIPDEIIHIIQQARP